MGKNKELIDPNDLRLARLFIGKEARMENNEVFYRGAIDVKVISVDEAGVMRCKVISTCCD